MAFTKQEKTALVSEYRDWLKRSQAAILIEFKGMTMKSIDDLRPKAREAGCEIHIVKNTLFKLVLDEAGITAPAKFFEGTTAVAFAFGDPPAAAKVFVDVTKGSEVYKLKGGILDNRVVRMEDIKALSELPPLPVMRARLLGVLSAPASQLVRTLAEPARSVASVLKSFSEKEAAPAAG